MTLPTPNKTPGDGAPAGDMNLVIEAINTLQSEVDNIPAGPQGPQGEPGTPGADGVAATVTVASTVTTEPGADAQVVQGGTDQHRTLAFHIPRGAVGPKGDTGATGAIGPTGATGAKGDKGDTGVVGADAPLSYDSLNKRVHLDQSQLQLEPPQVTGLDPAGQTGKFLTTIDGETLTWVASSSSVAWGAITGDITEQGDLQTALAAAVTEAEGYADSLAPNYDAAGAAAAAQSAAEAYADSLAPNYDAAGAAAAAQTAAEGYADSLATNYDAAGAAAAAESAAKSYADGLAVNYDAAGAAASAESAAKSYADGLAVNYDAAGAAASAESAAKSYADGLAVNYDPAGAASAVSGDLSTHEGSTLSVHGIADTSDLVYTTDPRLSDTRTPTDGSVTTAKIVDGNVTNGKLQYNSITINGTAVALGGSTTISGLPDQATHGGQYLTTNGSTASWASVTTDPTPTVFLLGGM